MITIPFPPTPWTPSRKSQSSFYNPKDKEKKRDIACVKSQKIWEFFGPVRVDTTFYMPIPKSFSKKKQKELSTEKVYHTAKPDLDNIRKFTSDILEAAGVFLNDSQIAAGYSEKFYSQNPRIQILVSELPLENE